MFDKRLIELNEENRISFPLVLSHDEYLILVRAATLKGMGRGEFIRRSLMDTFIRLQKEESLDLGIALPVEARSADRAGQERKE